ncbi:MAG: Smr/MutS family protein [Hyphomicrobiaceae bacterium]|nr:Smr/MutS family protein [Hyphomicrobiaceae bacterium]
MTMSGDQGGDDGGSRDEPMRCGRRRPLLSEEDRALWSHAARTMLPLRSGKPRIAHGAAGEPLVSQPRPQLRHERRVGDAEPPAPPMPPQSEAAAQARQPVAAPRPNPKPQSRPSAPPDLSDFEPRNARRLRSGRVEIEARIDLHGMRQNEAHAALVRFLSQAYGRGQRWVLVITGKGGPVHRERHVSDEVIPSVERGILRRAVPRWLAEPELRAFVVSYTTAAIHHGGEGALYVQLRARRTPV